MQVPENSQPKAGLTSEHLGAVSVSCGARMDSAAFDPGQEADLGRIRTTKVLVVTRNAKFLDSIYRNVNG